MKNLFYTILLITAPLFHLPVFGQTTEQQHLFTTIANSFGMAKPVPKLEIKRGKSCKNVAYYNPSQRKIVIEECFIDLSKKFGKDSTVALAIIMGHELAHYYKEHEWCSEFSYSNKDINVSGINSKSQNLYFETQADDSGLLAVSLAGYNPYEIYPELIKEIYSVYKLPNNLEGYQTKSNRINIALQTSKKANSLYPVFVSGLFLSSIGKDDFAISCFEHVLKAFPSREVFNNIAVCKIRGVLNNTSKLDLPFMLEIEFDAVSRLNTPTLRSVFTGNNDDEILDSAIDNLEKAILLDKRYSEAYYNLAICYVLKGKYAIALGKIEEASLFMHIIPNKALMLKSIIYFLDKEQDKATMILNNVESNAENIEFNKKIIAKGYEFFDSKLELNDWLEVNIPKKEKGDFTPKLDNMLGNEDFETISLLDKKAIKFKKMNTGYDIKLVDDENNFRIKLKVLEKELFVKNTTLNYFLITDFSQDKVIVIEY
jgi:tetratricopeptide (TPR) repeat protein